MTFNPGDRVRFIQPRCNQEYMLGWEGEILECDSAHGCPLFLVTLKHPTSFTTHTELYYGKRFELVTPVSFTIQLQITIGKLEKRQAFYQTYKQQLPTWYTAYGD